MPVYDMEMPQNHNFILDNGVIAHNCAYSELGYITMWLKTYYPLEWWTSVLNTVDSEDKRRQFMSILHKKLLLPSVNNAFSVFTIMGDKIATPISAVKGVGGAALQELMRCAPFTDIKDFVARSVHSKVNAGHVAALFQSRAFDVMLDQELPYISARDKMVTEYIKIRKLKNCNSLVDLPSNSLSIFLAEKSYNTCFNKRLLDDPGIVTHIIDWWPGVKKLPNRDIPLRIGETWILSGTDVAKKFLDNSYPNQVGMIMLYGGSTYKTGVSKKSGRTWHKLDVILSDGYNEIECTWWDKIAPLRWPKNSLVFVKGKIKTGYKTLVSITADEMELIEKIGGDHD